MNELITESLARKNVSYLYSIRTELLNPVQANWVAYVRGYNIKFGEPPSLQRFEKEFNTFVAVPDQSPLLDIFESTVVAVKNSFAKSYLLGKQAQLKDGEDPTDMVRELNDILQGSMGGTVQLSTYDKSQYVRAAKVFRTNVPSINAFTGGLVAGDMYLIAGRPGDGKTTLLLSQVVDWYLAGFKILLISNEIRYDDILWKVDCMLAGMNPIEKRSGTLSPLTKKKLLFLQQYQAKGRGEIIVPDRAIRRPSEVQALCQEHKPDIVAIDGVYLMSDKKGDTADWEDKAVVSRALKQIAMSENVLVAGVVQLNRDGEKNGISKSAVAGTDAYVQDSDFLIAVKPDTYAGGIREVLAQVVKNRHGVHGVATLLYNYETFKVEEKAE